MESEKLDFQLLAFIFCTQKIYVCAMSDVVVPDTRVRFRFAIHRPRVLQLNILAVGIVDHDFFIAGHRFDMAFVIVDRDLNRLCVMRFQLGLRK